MHRGCMGQLKKMWCMSEEGDEQFSLKRHHFRMEMAVAV